ncbi:MAG: diacylglycerol kinase family lipid kinase [Deltaproteobacteria bacterium]|nr:diacylglycerol kinase family lipid kinase [Deltaproteobacteria bacterium]
MSRKVVLIANPVAGKGRPEELFHLFVQAMERRGYRVETHITRTAGEATLCARTVKPEVEALVVAGGDGTLNEVLNGLVDPSRIPIALLPTGTANILAHELGLPTRAEAVAETVQGGRVRRLDMGLIGGRRFLAVVGAGFDAMVTQEVRRTRQRGLGYSGYVLPVLRSLVRYRVPELRITVDGAEQFQGAFAVVSNTRNYGGIFTFADQARCDSGHFDVCVFPKGTVFALTRYYFAALRGGVSGIPEVRYVTGRSVRIESEEPVAVQVDGDPFGATPVEIDLVPSTVPIIVSRPVS